MKRLDQIVLNIEFLLISVVQGVALSVLATETSSLTKAELLIFWPYIVTGLIFIFAFWAQSIIHTISFIGWPFSVSHSLLYFLVTFFEVLAFGELTNPGMWFLFSFIFFLGVAILYVVDLRLIKKSEVRFISSNQKELYRQIVLDQVFELKWFVPIGLIYTAISWWLVSSRSDLFHHLPLAIGQMLLVAFSSGISCTFIRGAPN
ncbi:MAG: hypothetical protein COU06_01695 [Candidatus Harrisonbacteria bacterium CG10_big_fil_rev_8_21_14_0_10_38_8]|uniref:Uncharacterized protein n=1 Tax=Candidatus Harrisonbacteria bacterium CG10_big_fil_rev_8_21_14_0_10_38_8 TaxID=1974582 RepID=A0A2M6WJY5_9BACT|nr:MAG: hypothetical protein COU06_01695 [Candidatus Harrisonbacteria bacterium CG10_big_fil_rev_8_21_14_0_10_38_8]